MLFISIHQDSNYPLHSGYVHETGHPELAPLTTINIPLPPGSGTGAYYYAFDKVVVPALARFQPDFILVSSGDIHPIYQKTECYSCLNLSLLL